MIPPSAKKHIHACNVSGCKNEGLFRAPINKDNLREYVWLCLEHVREHNAKWDFFKGFSEQDIEKQIRHDTVWERPTWPFGKGPASMKKEKKKPSEAPIVVPPQVRMALTLFNLPATTSLTAIKRRYRVLAKEYHPDTNKGSKEKIEKFHALQQAFATLQKYYAKKVSQKTYTQD